MKLAEFEALAPTCIVCDAKMKRLMHPTAGEMPPGSNLTRTKYYNINMLCSRNELCFGYISNAVSIYDVIVIDKFYISFPKIQLFAVVGEYTQVMANGAIMKLPYIPFDTWLRAKGQVHEKIDKLLVLANTK